jgi:hypothetical protein
MLISLHTLIEIENTRVLTKNEVLLNASQLEILFQNGMIGHLLDFLKISYLLWVCFLTEKIEMPRVKLSRVKNFDLLAVHQSK